MVALWPSGGFTSAAHAVELYYDAYPLAEVRVFLLALPDARPLATAGWWPVHWARGGGP